MVFTIILPGVLLSACSHSPGRTAAPLPASAPVETRVGVVRAVGPNQHFVLIETPSALVSSALSEGQLLHCRPPDVANRIATADVRVSRERHESLFVANVVAGEPIVGAIVYLSPTGATSTPSPSPDSISSVPTAPLPGLFGPRKP